jgi:hypothetical protein
MQKKNGFWGNPIKERQKAPTLHARYYWLLWREAIRPKIDLFCLLFGYFRVRSDATNPKTSLNQAKNL